MTFNLIAIFSGLVSCRAEADSPYSPVPRFLGGGKKKSGVTCMGGQRESCGKCDPQWCQQSFAYEPCEWKRGACVLKSSGGGEYCVKIMTEMEGPLSIKVVRRVNGREQGSPVVRRTLGQAKQMLGCSNDKIVRVDVWSGSQNGLWRGKILTNTPTSDYKQMRPTQKWNPHWNGDQVPCSQDNSFQVTGQWKYNCDICACLQTGPSRICSLITNQGISNAEGSNRNWLVQPTSWNYVAPTWTSTTTTTRPPTTTRTRIRTTRNPCSKNSNPGTPCQQDCECKSRRCGLRTWFGWISRNKCC